MSANSPNLIKVARLGSRAVEVALPAGATISEALSAAGYTVGRNEQVRLNGATASNSTRVGDGDLVTVVQSTIKGGTL